jgi:Flp pilus assembly protein TadB
LDPFQQQQQQQQQQMQRQQEEMHRQQQELQRQQERSLRAGWRDRQWRHQRNTTRPRSRAGRVARFIALIVVLAIFAVALYVLTHSDDIASLPGG